MADEIAQVCQMEIEGTTMVIKGSVKVISWLAQAIKALLQNAAERKTEHGGEKHDMRDIWKLSKDGPPQVIQVDEKNLQTVLSAAGQGQQILTVVMGRYLFACRRRIWRCFQQ